MKKLNRLSVAATGLLLALSLAAAPGCGKKEAGTPEKAKAPVAEKKTPEKKTPVAEKKAPVAEKKAPEKKKPAVAKVADLSVLDYPKLEARVKKAAKKLTVVAVWATWCVPCIKEMPELARFYEAHKAQGLDVLGLCTDDKAEMGDKIQDVLDKVKVPFAMATMPAGGDEPFFKAMGVEWDGGLPATAAFDSTGKRVLYLREPLTPEVLEKKVLPLLAAAKKP